jgi:capsular polysaccharide biosynthesis protein
MTEVILGRLLARAWHRIRDDRAYRPSCSSPANLSGPHSADADTRRLLASLGPDDQQRFRSLAELIENLPSEFLFQLALFKEDLTSRLPMEDAFNIVRALLKFPQSVGVELRPMRSLAEVSRAQATTFRESAPSGGKFTIHPPKVLGNGDHRPIDCVTRSLYVACLEDACVRGRSSFIAFRDAELLDFEGGELARADERFAVDPPVVAGSVEDVWIRAPQPAELALDRAFTLLGPMTPQFGHWMWEYMPKYVVAGLAAELDGVPVLIDAHMPATHRQFLRMLLPSSTDVIEVPYSASVRVAQLWCAPRLFFVPVFPRSYNPSRVPDRAAPPERFAAAVHEMWRRLDVNRHTTSGPKRVFLARKAEQNHKLRDHVAIEELAERRGFVIIYPQDLDFADQLALMQGARYIIGPAGSAMFLSYLARPGTKLCMLDSENTFRATTYTCLLEELDIDVSLLTGSVVQESEVPHHADYSIPAKTFAEFLDSWLE